MIYLLLFLFFLLLIAILKSAISLLVFVLGVTISIGFNCITIPFTILCMLFLRAHLGCTKHFLVYPRW